MGPMGSDPRSTLPPTKPASRASAYVGHLNPDFCSGLCEVLGEATEKIHEVVDYAEKLLGFAVNQLKEL